MAHIAGRLEVFMQRVAKAWLRVDFLHSERLLCLIRFVAANRENAVTSVIREVPRALTDSVALSSKIYQTARKFQ